MKKDRRLSAISLLMTACFLLPAGLLAEEANASLDSKQRDVVSIAAFTAVGDIENLRRALNDGLDDGLTVNEIGEILLQMYAYAGFPRSLNGMGLLSEVLEERQAKGIRDPYGTEPEPLPEDADRYGMGVSNLGVLMGFPLNQRKAETNGYGEAMDAFLKEHLFADIFGRDNLSFDMRELATVGALSGLEGTNSQLMFHMNAAMNCGVTEGQMNHFVAIIGEELGTERESNAKSVLMQVLERRRGMN